MFKVGETYLTKNGHNRRKVVAICPDGRLIVEDSISLSYRSSDGVYLNNHALDLVDPDHVTPREQETVAKLCDAACLPQTVSSHCRKNASYIINDGSIITRKFLEILREFKGN